MKKRGQVTIFIIIGIVILIALLGFAFREQIGRTLGRLLQPEAEPLRVFIERCADISGNKAIELASRQGGYVRIPEKLALSFDGYIPPPPSPLQVPMWWYKGANYAPTVDEVEQQLADYVKENMEQCLSEFDAFAQYDVIEKGELAVDAELHENDVRFVVDYPILIKPKNANNTIQIGSLAVAVEKPFGKLYTLAQDIMKLENDIGFVENLTMDIIAVADGAGDSPYFPYEGIDIRCGEGKVWSEQFQLIPDLQDLMHYNLNYVTFVGTDYADPGYEYFRDQYSLRASTRDYPDVNVKILYNKNWGMELDVQPSDGDIVKGIPIAIPIVGSCIRMYHHFYDIQYPVMFQLTDLEKGLIFNFATPVVIEKNLPKRYVSPFVQRFEYSVGNADFCANTGDERTIIARDEMTGEAVEDASVQYECVRFTCELGRTELPTFDGIPIYGATPSLTTKMPLCTNGFIVANKDGYLESVLQYTSGPGAGTPPAVMMTPLKKLNISARIVEIQGSTTTIRPMEADEIVVVFVRESEKNYEESFFYPPREFYKKDVELIFGDITYDELDVKLVKGRNVIGGLYIQNWTVTRNQLSAADEIIVNVLTPPSAPATLEEFAQFHNDVVVPNSETYAPVIR
jgi:hypothetical protein